MAPGPGKHRRFVCGLCGVLAPTASRVSQPKEKGAFGNARATASCGAAMPFYKKRGGTTWSVNASGRRNRVSSSYHDNAMSCHIYHLAMKPSSTQMATKLRVLEEALSRAWL